MLADVGIKTESGSACSARYRAVCTSASEQCSGQRARAAEAIVIHHMSHDDYHPLCGAAAGDPMTTSLPDLANCHACLDAVVTLGVAAAKRLRDLRAAEPAPEPCSRCGRPEAPECCAAGPPAYRAARVERRG